MSQAKPITLLQLSTRHPEFDQALAARLQSQLASKPRRDECGSLLGQPIIPGSQYVSS